MEAYRDLRITKYEIVFSQLKFWLWDFEREISFITNSIRGITVIKPTDSRFQQNNSYKLRHRPSPALHGQQTELVNIKQAQSEHYP